MGKKILLLLPWRVLVPLIFISGICFSGFAGYNVSSNFYSQWVKDLSNNASVFSQNVINEVHTISDYQFIPNGVYAYQKQLDNHFDNVSKKYPEIVANVFIAGNGSFLYASKGSAPEQANIYDAIINCDTKIKYCMVSANGLLENNSNADIITVVQNISNRSKNIYFIDVKKLFKEVLNKNRNTYVDDINDISLDFSIKKDNNTIFVTSLNKRADISTKENFPIVKKVFFYDWVFDWNFSYMSMGGSVLFYGALTTLFGFIITGLATFFAARQRNYSLEVHHKVSEKTRELEQASRGYRTIIDTAYDIIAITGLDGRFLYTNNAFHRVLDYSKADISEKTFIDFVHPDDKGTVDSMFFNVGKGRNSVEMIFRMKNKSGEWRYVEAVAKGMHDENWDLNRAVINCHDVTQRKRASDEILRSQQRALDFAESSADWLWEVDQNLNFTYVSPGVTTTLGYNPEYIVGQNKMRIFFGNSKDIDSRFLVEESIKKRNSYKNIEFWTTAQNGDSVCLRVSARPVFDNGKFFGYRGAATNVTSSKRDQDNLFKMATTDHLTGLLNRTRFAEELERVSKLAEHQKTQGVLLFIDLDHFKYINDTYGHDAGDEVLAKLGPVISESMHSTDVVSRLGGDEFGIIMYDVSLDEAKEKVEQMMKKIEKLTIPYKGVKLQVSLSLGMISFPRDNNDATTLLMSADMAMYRAKELGRNRLFIDETAFSESNAESNTIRKKLEWLDVLKKCLDKGSFDMHFQPLVPLKSHPNPHFEALIRIYDDEGKMIFPDQFIDLAEHYGLIQKLDYKVMERCFETQKAMAKEGKIIELSVNISSRTIADKETIEAMKQLVKDYNIDPTLFTIEITETSAIGDINAHRKIEDALDFIVDMKKLGFKFALDDFGVGFSSFNYLKLLPVDCIKLDGSYVKNLPTSHTDKVFCKAISSLAHGLDMYTVAEFVENSDIIKILQELGVTYAQGYKLSKPNPDIELMYDRFVNKTMDDFLD